MSAIKDIKGRKIYDSRGNPTIEVDVILEQGIIGRASVPSGASTGKTEVFKITDIKQALTNIESLKQNLVNQNASDQEKLDLLMINIDGSKRKNNLGGNVILALSLAICNAAANEKKIPLFRYINSISGINLSEFKMPIPYFNIINGGKHSDNNLPFQEFMVVPQIDGTFSQKLEAGVNVYQHLKKDLKEKNLTTNVGDEGGFAPQISVNEEAMELLVDAIEHTGLKPNEDMTIALDVAASSIPDLNAVTYPSSPIDYFEKILDEYPISSIEDPLIEDDVNGWVEITKRLGNKINIVGDDIFTTNPEIFEKYAKMGIANTILIKPDQIGTLTETIKTIKLARAHNYKVMISHRSGETESAFISDLAVGAGADYIKSGAPSRGERVAKYNQLLRIEEDLNSK